MPETESELVARTGSDNRLVITVRGDGDAFEKWLGDSDKVAKVTRKRLRRRDPPSRSTERIRASGIACSNP